ncbi:MAG TPA: hypothetical protein VH394_17865 [Thermoanaerobaculia bacterium]|jgi:hypothetical protein|nr:hypothetical protein [Thermoanaerobaculia bacterium]
MWEALVIPAVGGGLRIRGERILQLRLREIEIGDKAFDTAFSIEGPVPLVASLLDAEVGRRDPGPPSRCLARPVVAEE